MSAPQWQIASSCFLPFFFFNDTATTEIYTLSLHDALPIPEPLVWMVAELLRRTLDFSPEQSHFLQFGRVADTTAARERLGFTPKWSSPEAFRDFAASQLGSRPAERDEFLARRD